MPSGRTLHGLWRANIVVDTAFVLAGGLGTRLRSFVSDVPKPMANVGGRPFLEHLLDYLLAQGAEDIVLCVGHLRKIIQAHFGQSYRGTSISYSFEEPPTGTGGALSRALRDFQPTNPFLVCNGDTFFPIDTSQLVDCARGKSWAIATFRSNDFERYGALSVGPDGALQDVGGGLDEVPSASAAEVQANSGVWIGNPGKITLPLLASEIRYSLENYISQSLRAGTVTAVAREFDSPFIDIGLPTDFARAQSMQVFAGS